MQVKNLLTDFESVSLPDSENEMSRRYLEVATRWVHTAERADISSLVRSINVLAFDAYFTVPTA
jgi:hypothetical protein